MRLKTDETLLQRRIYKIPQGDAMLALHAWLPASVKAAVFLFHGLQSHASWSWEIGEALAQRGVALFVLDRRGSGTSTGPHGAITDADTCLSDYITALDVSQSAIGNEVPFTLFGHCLGGSFLAALLASHPVPENVSNIIMCTTWLAKLTDTLTEVERGAVAIDQDDIVRDVGLRPSDFTTDVRYLDFIQTDDRAVRAISGRSRANLLAIERKYADARHGLATIPSAFVSGKSDPVIDLSRAIDRYWALFPKNSMVVQFPESKHYLFFTESKNNLARWLSARALGEEV